MYENSTKLYKRDDMVLEDGDMTTASIGMNGNATLKLGDVQATHKSSHSKGDSIGS